MLDHNSFSALDRHAALGGSDNGFPWYAGAMFGTEACDIAEVEKSRRDDGLTVGEAIAFVFGAAASWLSGTTPPAILNHYRAHVAGNAGRLSAS
ncbi:hypothetical protein C2U70_08040 [Bradyrhizobium guangdongense]|uniref:hypothetical protein n=1 Tax=Bradyrhizobium guangdongense TaxID=1325090 RepID=UPI001127300A|nr:hypothetical protein [Bradyrhizobium guangdongense]TPQ38944.1 hypothetical protein C2U70_08040 [Bradyrhizobium guangdongense]